MSRLEEEKLRVDREGQARTAYSLRHKYICLRLIEGADIYQIAMNCRTPVAKFDSISASIRTSTTDTPSPATAAKDRLRTEF